MECFRKVGIVCFICFICLSSCYRKADSNTSLNDVMMQAFYWDVPVDDVAKDGTWWDNLREKAPELKKAGITAIWTPVPAKGNWGIIDNGYGVYDHYDLGNYEQKGTVETRFGSRAELEQMIAVMHEEPRIDVYCDVVLNHTYASHENEEVNPAVKAYVFSEAQSEEYMPYPANEIRWVMPNAAPGDYRIQIKGYCLPWSSEVSERGYEMYMCWDDGGMGTTQRAFIEDREDVDEYKITLMETHDIEIRLTAKREVGVSKQWVDAGSMLGYYPVAVWYNGVDITEHKLQARTNTRYSYPQHTGPNEPNYTWSYRHFHPVDVVDSLTGYGSDEIMTNTKFFGNDLNTYDETVKSRLKDWGQWLMKSVGFDGFRLDFVRGYQEAFVADWVSNLPHVDGKQPFVVGEYWGSDSRIQDWVNNVANLGADVDAFDFPLKNTLTSLCNGSGASFNMALLDHAGMVRNSTDNALPGTSVVTFLENHDTGKEHDKWVTKDFHLGYAYILTHEGKPCLFYPHFFGDTQYDTAHNSHSVTAPEWLQESIIELIEIRKQYLGGIITVLTQIGNPYPSANTSNVYIARRQGNGVKDGAIVVLNNHDTDTKSTWVTVNASGFTDWSNETLVNLLNTNETVTVQSDGRVELSAPARSYSIWAKQSDVIDNN